MALTLAIGEHLTTGRAVRLRFPDREDVWLVPRVHLASDGRIKRGSVQVEFHASRDIEITRHEKMGDERSTRDSKRTS